MTRMPTIPGTLPKRHVKSLLIASISLAHCSVAPLAIAQVNPNDRAAADALFEEGKASLKSGDWATACDKFQRSLGLDPSASTLVKTARCHEHDGHSKAAWADYARALELLRARAKLSKHDRDLISIIESAKGSLESKLGRLRVQVSPKPNQLTLTLDGEVIEFDSDGLLLEPGTHTIGATAPGYHAPALQVTIAPGQAQDIELQLVADAEPATPQPSVAPEPSPTAAPAAAVEPIATASPLAVNAHAQAPSPAPGRGQRTVGYVAGGTGLALLGTAAYFGIRTASLVSDAHADNHCDSAMNCDPIGLGLIADANREQTKAIAFGTAGAVFTGLGLALLLTAPSSRKATTALYERMLFVVSPWGGNLGGTF